VIGLSWKKLLRNRNDTQTVISYLDESNTGIGSVFQTAYAELDIREIQPMRQLTLKRLVTRGDRG